MNREPSHSDDRIQRLINRRLDGELNGDESLELDKTLIRSPEVRRELDELQRIDRLAGDAVRSLRQGPVNSPGGAQPAAGDFAIRRAWTGGLARGAIAASLLLAIGAASWMYTREIRQRGTISADDRAPIIAQWSGTHVDTSADRPAGQALAESLRLPSAGFGDSVRGQGLQPAGFRGASGPQRVIGVLDDRTQRLYLLEMPAAAPRVRY